MEEAGVGVPLLKESGVGTLPGNSPGQRRQAQHIGLQVTPKLQLAR